MSSYEEALTALEVELTAPSASLAVLLIEMTDVPRFQARLGFAGSGALLHKLQDGFAAALGARGRIVRLGDGCFCAFVRGVRNGGHAVLAAERLLRCADDLLGLDGVAIKPQIRVGISIHPGHGTRPEALLRSAQLATEAARNRSARFVIYDEICSAEVIAPWDLGNAFAEALEDGDLSVFYQPKIRIATQRPVGVESLMRWLRGGQPVATPDVFIPLASDAGLIQSTTWYSLNNSLRVSAGLNHLPVAVNVTPDMLHHRDFLPMIRSAAATWSVDGNLTLEITEGALIADFAEASARLAALRNMGIRVSIDDFGTGYSSLSYFKKIPADELKIDKSFVKGITTDRSDARLAQTIIDLAVHFKLEVVAEGVEDRATYELLAGMGCDLVQGYLFSPALSAEDLARWLIEHPVASR